MNQFLINNYLLLTNGVAFVAAIVGSIYISKFKNTEVKYFVYFLWYVAIIQFLGTYPSFVKTFEFLSPLKKLIEGTRFEVNYWVFTIFWSMGSTLFYSYYFQRILHNVIHKRILKVLTYVYILCSISYFIMRPEELFTQMIPFIKIGNAIVILVCSIFYFIKILKSDQLLSFYKSINFFISATIFIWWMVTTPVLFYQVYHSTADWNFVFLRWQIFLFMNLFMYLTFTFAFIWCEPKNDLE